MERYLSAKFPGAPGGKLHDAMNPQDSSEISLFLSQSREIYRNTLRTC